MHADVFESKWKQMQGDLRSWWGKLTDNDLERIAGKQDRLIAVLQEKYGYTREVAQQDVDRHFRGYEERFGGTATGEKEQAMGAGAQRQQTAVDEKTARDSEDTAAMSKASQSIAA